jgi:hypothetical protein
VAMACRRIRDGHRFWWPAAGGRVGARGLAAAIGVARGRSLSTDGDTGAHGLPRGASWHDPGPRDVNRARGAVGLHPESDADDVFYQPRTVGRRPRHHRRATRYSPIRACRRFEVRYRWHRSKPCRVPSRTSAPVGGSWLSWHTTDRHIFRVVVGLAADPRMGTAACMCCGGDRGVALVGDWASGAGRVLHPYAGRQGHLRIHAHPDGLPLSDQLVRGRMRATRCYGRRGVAAVGLTSTATF